MREPMLMPNEEYTLLRPPGPHPALPPPRPTPSMCPALAVLIFVFVPARLHLIHAGIRLRSDRLFPCCVSCQWSVW